MRAGGLRRRHHIINSNTCGRLCAVSHSQRGQPVPLHAQSVPGRHHDHHNWWYNCCFSAGFHYHPDDSLQGLQQPRGQQDQGQLQHALPDQWQPAAAPTLRLQAAL